RYGRPRGGGALAACVRTASWIRAARSSAEPPDMASGLAQIWRRSAARLSSRPNDSGLTAHAATPTRLGSTPTARAETGGDQERSGADATAERRTRAARSRRRAARGAHHRSLLRRAGGRAADRRRYLRRAPRLERVGSGGATPPAAARRR